MKKRFFVTGIGYDRMSIVVLSAVMDGQEEARLLINPSDPFMKTVRTGQEFELTLTRVESLKGSTTTVKGVDLEDEKE